VLDGVYRIDRDGSARFHALPPPSDAAIAALVLTLARRIARLLEGRGLGRDADPEEVDPLARDEPLLASLYGASVASRIATGPRAGRRVERQGDLVDADVLPRLSGPRCASVAGVSLHANVEIPASDRARLERLCRYTARPAIASARLSRLPDGKLHYALKHPWRDGTTGFVFTAGELIEKLAALVPAPRHHLVRYHGILGPAARARRGVVPTAISNPTPSHSSNAALPSRGDPRADPPLGDRRAGNGKPDPSGSSAPSPVLPRPCRTAWADLLRRVFAIDVLQCPRCRSRLRILAVIHSLTATRAILESLGLPARAPPIDPPRGEPEIGISQDAEPLVPDPGP